MERDLFMSPQEAKEFGIIDEVIEQHPSSVVTDAAARTKTLGHHGGSKRDEPSAAT